MKPWMKACLALSVVWLLGMAAQAEAGIVWVPPFAFHPADPFTQSLSYTADNSGLYLSSPDSTHFIAPISLPNGMTIKKVSIYVSHNSNWVDDALRFYVYRLNLATGSTAQVASLNSTGLANYVVRTTLSTTSITNKVVNNTTYTYFVDIAFYGTCTENCKFFGAKIEY